MQANIRHSIYRDGFEKHTHAQWIERADTGMCVLKHFWCLDKKSKLMSSMVCYTNKLTWCTEFSTFS